MDINELLIESHKHLDAATVENELNNECMCMFHLGYLHGLLLKFVYQENQEKCESAESSE